MHFSFILVTISLAATAVTAKPSLRAASPEAALAKRDGAVCDVEFDGPVNGFYIFLPNDLGVPGAYDADTCGKGINDNL